MTTAGVRGFQNKRGMPESGSVDQATWTSLTSMTRQPTKDELSNTLTPGPALLKQGSTGAKVRDLQARLKQIGWWSGDVVDTYGATTAAAVKWFQAKRADPGHRRGRPAHPRPAERDDPTPDHDELNNVSRRLRPRRSLDPRCMTGRVMCIGKTSRR